MKILLDECVTKHFKPYLLTHEVVTVREKKWSGVKNGELMHLCVAHGFDLLLTIDKNLQFQQNLELYPVAIVVLNSRSSKVEDLVPFLPMLNSLLADVQKHRVYVLNR